MFTNKMCTIIGTIWFCCEAWCTLPPIDLSLLTNNDLSDSRATKVSEAELHHTLACMVFKWLYYSLTKPCIHIKYVSIDIYIYCTSIELANCINYSKTGTTEIVICQLYKVSRSWFTINPDGPNTNVVFTR
jgi:hypothetical protein